MKFSILFLLYGLKVVFSIIGEDCVVTENSEIQQCSIGEICQDSQCQEARECSRDNQCGGTGHHKCVSWFCQRHICSSNSYCVAGLFCHRENVHNRHCHKPHHINVTEGSEAVLPCSASGVTVHEKTWYHGSVTGDGARISSLVPFSKPVYYGDYCSTEGGTSSCDTPTPGISLTEGGELIIERTRLSDSGFYTCYLRASSSSHRYLRLNVYDIPEVSIEGIPPEVPEGTEVSMNCTVRSNSTQSVEFYWIIDGKRISGYVFAWQRESNGDVFVNSNYTYKVSREDKGKLIQCHVVPTYGNETFAEHNIGEILFEPSGSPTAQASTDEEPNGERVTLTCTPPSDSGNPPCSTFMWIREDGNLNYTSPTPDFRLLMDDFLSGGYYCICSNQIGSSNASGVVTILSLGGEPNTGKGGLVAGLVVCVLVIVVIVVAAMVVCKRCDVKITPKMAKEETATSGTTEIKPKNEDPTYGNHKVIKIHQNKKNKNSKNTRPGNSNKKNNSVNNNTTTTNDNNDNTTNSKNDNKTNSNNDNTNSNCQTYEKPKRQAVSVISDYQEINEAIVGRSLDEEIVARPADPQSVVNSYENLM